MSDLRAVYKNEKGQNYSAPIEKQSDGTWMMLTSEGPVPITHQFQDDAGGLLSFVEYREVPDSRLHVEQGADPFRALQNAGARARAADLTNRQRARREALVGLNQPDVKKMQEIHRLNNAHAQQMRPRGGGAYIIKGEQ
jgi:hypothetical protein